MTHPDIDLILFDLGGVLVINDGPARIAKWLGALPSEAEMLDRWLTSPTIRAFESGRIDFPAFAKAIIEETGAPLTPEQFLTEFKQWVTRYYPGVEDTLRQLKQRHRLACLSNTNPVHWHHIKDEMGLGALMDGSFISYQLGLVKPDRQIFDAVIEQADCPAERILFFDDSPRNIDSARAAGLNAHHTVGFEAVLDILKKLNLGL